MPLIQEGSCKAFWKNYSKLFGEFKAEHGEEKARKMAIAAASDVARNNGGSPSECMKNKEE